jgi:hypothetical protein
LNSDLTTSQSSEQVNLGAIEQVILLALESGVFLLFDNENDISGYNVWALITLSIKDDLGPVLHSLIDMDMQDLALLDDLLSVAVLALVLLPDGLSLSITVGTNGLESLNHWTHLAHHGLGTHSVTGTALLDRTLLASASITLRAQDVLLESEFRDLALVEIFERNLVDVDDISAL